MLTKNSNSDAASHVLAAYKGAPFEKDFRIEHLQYWKVAVVQFFCRAGQWYFTAYYKNHKIETKIN